MPQAQISSKLPITNGIKSLKINTLTIAGIANISERSINKTDIRDFLVFCIFAVPFLVGVVVDGHIIVLDWAILFLGLVVPDLLAWLVDVVVSGFYLFVLLFCPVLFKMLTFSIFL